MRGEPPQACRPLQSPVAVHQMQPWKAGMSTQSAQQAQLLSHFHDGLPVQSMHPNNLPYEVTDWQRHGK